MEWYLAASAGIAIYESQKQAAMMRGRADAAALSGEISLEQAQFEARQARIQGHEQATYMARESERALGRMAAKTGASGADFKGSPIVVMGDQIYRDQMAIATTISNASAKSRSIEAAGRSNLATGESNAAVMRQQAGLTEEAGWLSAIADGIGASAAYYNRTGGPAEPPPYRADSSTDYGAPTVFDNVA